jgi:hypothetical protein
MASGKVVKDVYCIFFLARHTNLQRVVKWYWEILHRSWENDIRKTSTRISSETTNYYSKVNTL